MLLAVYLVSSFGAVAAAALAGSSSYPQLPIYYSYGGYPRVMSDILYGTPPLKLAIPAVVDLGSANYWVYGPNATVNYGSQFLGQTGPCNISVRPFYDYPKSNTATKRIREVREYGYGGNGKIVAAYYSINDTISFHNPAFKPLTNTQVELSNFTILRQAATSCNDSSTIEYDHSILGLSRFNNPTFNTTGPSFRQNLLTSGKIRSPVMSMWFNKAPQAVNGTFHGTVQFGAIPSNKYYSGTLTQLKLRPPSQSYVGYYIPAPNISITGLPLHTSDTPLAVGKTPRCLLDSGTGLDNLALSQHQFLNAAGLVLFKGYPAYNGSCAAIPATAALKFTFPGRDPGARVTVSVPLRNYARGITDVFGTKKCGLSLSLYKGQDCVLGAPFTTALFLAVDDAEGSVAIAQGGVA